MLIRCIGEKIRSARVNDLNICYFNNYLDMLNDFLKENEEFGIFCQSNIYFLKDFESYLPEILGTTKRLKLECVLLGYSIIHHPCISKNMGINFINYDSEDAQFFLLERNYCKYLVENFKELNKDTITKTTKKRAMIFPMLSVEDDSNPDEFHRKCHHANKTDTYT